MCQRRTFVTIWLVSPDRVAPVPPDISSDCYYFKCEPDFSFMAEYKEAPLQSCWSLVSVKTLHQHEGMLGRLRRCWPGNFSYCCSVCWPQEVSVCPHLTESPTGPSPSCTGCVTTTRTSRSRGRGTGPATSRASTLWPCRTGGSSTSSIALPGDTRAVQSWRSLIQERPSTQHISPLDIMKLLVLLERYQMMLSCDLLFTDIKMECDCCILLIHVVTNTEER